MSVAPFKPVSKADAAEVLGVGCTKTIDNYIKDGLLPQPVRFAGRDLWHPDDFYGHLSSKLRRGFSSTNPIAAPSEVGTAQTEDVSARGQTHQASMPARKKSKREAAMQRINAG